MYHALTSVVKDGCSGCPSAPTGCGTAPERPADTAPAAAIAADVTDGAFVVAAAAAPALASAGDVAFLSGGLKYTGNGLPPMGLPLIWMCSYWECTTMETISVPVRRRCLSKKQSKFDSYNITHGPSVRAKEADDARIVYYSPHNCLELTLNRSRCRCHLLDP